MDGGYRAAVSLGDPPERLPGVGAKRAESLARLGVATAGDLLTLWPRRYADRSALREMGGLLPGETATVVGTVQAVAWAPRPGRAPLLKITAGDRTGVITAVFFHGTWIGRQLTPGTRVLFTGRVDVRGRQVTMTHPDFEVLKAGEEPALGLVPIYPLAGDLRQRFVQQLMRRAVPALAPQKPDPLPAALVEKLGLVGRAWAVMTVHAPGSYGDFERARRRVVFDEFLRMSLAVLLIHRHEERVAGRAQQPNGPLSRRFLENLRFALTPGQLRAWEEIAEDLARPRPMARLLQGDVGSGKTVIAALSLLAAVDAGRQAALMAPTELLAEQQFRVLQELFEPIGVSVGLVTGKGKGTKEARERLASGELAVAVGTQALLSPAVRFTELGVVVIDEQHRFGVRQRAELSDKGYFPDMLVMTATPIPRTLALTVYGDLEVSRIEGLPPGRQPITTRHVTNKDRREAYQKIREEIKAGRQAYVVCPLVGENDEINAKAAVELAEGMKRVPGWRVGLLHGKMSSQEKAEAMERFRAGADDVLVSTTIVEVGVDIPNATVMVIEGADRFGLAQLHQLRGRVGRGRHPAVCYLVADPATEEAQARIEAMLRTQDGLELAEADLALRGPGEVLGMRQHGVAGFQLADPVKDLALLETAREVARAILEQDPRLEEAEHHALKVWVNEAIQEALPSHVLH